MKSDEVFLRHILDELDFLLKQTSGIDFGAFAADDVPRRACARSLEAVLAQRAAGITELDIRTALDYLCEVGREQEVFFLWRPTLRDPDDDMVLELAVAAGCVAVVTYNVRDFQGTDRFGIEVWTPVDLLRKVGLLS